MIKRPGRHLPEVQGMICQITPPWRSVHGPVVRERLRIIEVEDISGTSLELPCLDWNSPPITMTLELRLIAYSVHPLAHRSTANARHHDSLAAPDLGATRGVKV